MRVPIHTYLTEGSARVYSLVAAVPYSPIDIDLGRLSRGEWNPITDRFRIWYLPRNEARDPRSDCHLMIRKFDVQDQVLVYEHVVVNPRTHSGCGSSSNFTVGIMSNDNIRARATLNSMLEMPPSFHRRNEIRLIERRWRRDPYAIMRFTVNVRSVTFVKGKGVTHLGTRLPPGVVADMGRSMRGWWD